MTLTAVTVISDVDDIELLRRSFQSYEPYVDEIIVGNNNMSYEHKDAVQSSKVRMVDVQNTAYVELVRQKLHEGVTTDFILVIDPDEVVSGGLIDELKELGKQYSFIRIPRKNIIFDKWIEHSRWWPDFQLRFFRKGSVTWAQKLHSVPMTSGEGYDMPIREENAITHLNYTTIDQYLSKMFRYAKAEAHEKINNENYSVLIAIKQGLDEFSSRYYFAQGYKDGMHGFVLSILQMFNAFLVYFYWWEEKKHVYEEKHLHSAPYSFFKDGLKNVLFWSEHEHLKQDQLPHLYKKIVNKFLK